MLIGKTCAVSEFPSPTGNPAHGVILECNETPIHVEDFEAPTRVDGFLKLRFQWHQSEFVQERCVSVHAVLWRKVPEAIVFLVAVIVDHSPGQADDLVLIKLRLHRALRTVAAGIVEGRRS